MTSRLLTVVALALATTACSSGLISSAGPTTGQVTAVGAAKSAAGIRLIDVTDSVARRILATKSRTSFSATFGESAAAGTMINAGDAVEVSIWEAAPAALFGVGGDPRTAAATGARPTVLPEQMIGTDGNISVPFVGTVTASGRPPRDVEAEIVRRLSRKAHQPQVMVRIVRNATSAVTVIGEVGGSTRVPLTARGERLLDVLASAGGVRQPVGKITLQLTRGARVAAMPLERIVTDPAENIALRSGDVVTALFQPLSFTVLGASGRNEELPMEAQGITLAQALGRIGGLQDQRADARGVFIFRLEDPAALTPEQLVGLGRTPEGRVPVIYRIDLRDPATFFVAQGFPVRDKDVVYVSNAPLADAQKVLNLLSSAIFPLASASTLLN